MDISPHEAEETLAAIQSIAQKTRRSIAGSGVYITLLVTGCVWLVGYLGTQFLPGQYAAYLWFAATTVGSIAGTFMGIHRSKHFRSPSTVEYAKRIGLFWLLLILFGIAVIVITRPADGKQLALLVILFIMLGQLSMGLLLSFSSVWWALPISGLALAGYYLLPAYFYLWMAVLGGGGMIAFALYIRSRW